MLSVTNICKSFGTTTILNGATFHAQPGALTILEGQNGAGKSTLFGILCGVIKSDAGDIALDDVNLGALSAIERALLIGTLKQDPKSSSVLSLSVIDNCALALLKGKRACLHTATTTETRQTALAHFNELNLPFAQALDKPLGDFSGGQRQMIAFAMATLTKPRLLLLDEPTAALDPKSSELLMTLVKQFLAAWHIPAVMISHDRDLNRRFADTIFVLQDGAITT